MNYTEEQLKEIAIKIMEGLDKDYYFKDQIDINKYENGLKPLWGDKIEKGWVVSIGIPDSQFQHEDGASILLFIDDETEQIINYVEGPGRPFPLTVKLNDEGKYVFSPVINFDVDKYY